MKKKLMFILAILFIASSVFAMKVYLTNSAGSGQAQTNPNASLGGYRSTTELSAVSMKNLFDNVSIWEALLGDVEYRMIDIYNDGATDALRVQFYMRTPTSSPKTELNFGYSATAQPHADAWNGEALADESTAPASPAMTFTNYTKTAPVALGTIPAGESARICVRRTVTAGAGGWTAQDLGSFGLRWGAAAGATNYVNDANCMGAWYMNSTLAVSETDATGNGEDLVVTGSIPTSATVPTGYAGTSRDMELSDSDLFSVADGGECDISGANQSLSIVCWIKCEQSGLAASMGLVSKYLTTGNQRQYRLRLTTTTDNVGFLLSSAGTAASATALGATDVCDGAWHHIAAVYNDTDLRIYVDGVLDSNGADNPKTYSDGIYGGTALLCVGAETSAAGNPYDGLIDEVAIFNRALSAAEVLDIKTNGISGDKGGS